MSIAAAFPTVAGDFVSPADAAGGEDDGFGLKQLESAMLALVAKSTDNSVAIFEKRDDGAFHMHFHTLVDAVILEGTDHFQAGAVANVGEAGIFVAAEIALEDAAIFGAI